MLNLFYSEPDPDRWFKFDRYPRHLIRRIIRGKQKPGGVMMIVLNLMKGLDKIGIPYRLNDYKYIKKNPREIACIIGKPHVLLKKKWINPVILGAGIYSHPIDCPDLFVKYPNVKRFLVPGEWMRKMFEPYYGNKVTAWPVGIDTDYWHPMNGDKQFDFLIYDKIRWQRDEYKLNLVDPIIKILEQKNISYRFIRYGNYVHEELMDGLKLSKAVIFICEHETQGLAYQQILSTGTPILAWDRGGYWQDPSYYPDKVVYGPVSSVPYWDDLCGIKFKDIAEFKEKVDSFLNTLTRFNPRKYIMDNLSLEKCAANYLRIYNEVEQELN